MISQTEVDLRINEILNGQMPPIQVSIYYEVSDPEDVIVICRGDKRDFDDVLHFWVKARQRREWWDRGNDGEGFGHNYEDYASHAASVVRSDEPMEYKQLTRAEFYNFVDGFARMSAPSQPLSKVFELDSLSENYLKGVSTVTAWNNVSALAEFEFEYVALHWETLA